MTTYSVVLLLLACGIVAYEFWAIGRPGAGDTISEHVWRIRASALGRYFIGAGIFWLAYHFTIDRYAGQGWWDALAILLGVVVARWAGPHRGGKRLPK